MKGLSLSKPVSLVLSVCFLLYTIIPLAGCSGGGYSGSGSAPTSSAQTGTVSSGTASQAIRSSVVRTENGYVMAVARGQQGARGEESISVDVAAGTKVLTLAPSGAVNNSLVGVSVRVYGPGGKLMGTIIDGKADRGALATMPSSSAELDESLTRWAQDSKAFSPGSESSAIDTFGTSLQGVLAAGGEMPAELSKEVTSYFSQLSSLADAGNFPASTESGGQTAPASAGEALTIFNPTSGAWKIEVSSLSSPSDFDLVAMAVPSDGLPAGDAIKNLVSQLQLTTGWDPSMMFRTVNDSASTLKGDRGEVNNYWLYDSIHWLVKTVFKPSTAVTVMAYLIVTVYPPAVTKFGQIKSLLNSLLQSVISAIGTSTYDAFTDSLAHVVAKAVCTLFKQPYRAGINHTAICAVSPLRTPAWLTAVQ